MLRHRLGTDPADDVVVLEEHDAAVRAEPAGHPERRPDRDLEREPLDQRGVGRSTPRRPSRRRARSAGGGTACVYRVEHAPSPAGDRMLVVTNDGAVEFRLMTAPVPRDRDQDASVWVEARPEHADERLLQADAFADGVVLSYRSGGAAPAADRRARRPRRRRPRPEQPLRRRLSRPRPQPSCTTRRR